MAQQNAQLDAEAKDIEKTQSASIAELKYAWRALKVGEAFPQSVPLFLIGRLLVADCGFEFWRKVAEGRRLISQGPGSEGWRAFWTFIEGGDAVFPEHE